MIYFLEYSNKFEKQIKKLENKDKIRVILALEKIRIKPYSFIEKLNNSNNFKF